MWRLLSICTSVRHCIFPKHKCNLSTSLAARVHEIINTFERIFFVFPSAAQTRKRPCFIHKLTILYMLVPPSPRLHCFYIHWGKKHTVPAHIQQVAMAKEKLVPHIGSTDVLHSVMQKERAYTLCTQKSPNSRQVVNERTFWH